MLPNLSLLLTLSFDATQLMEHR